MRNLDAKFCRAGSFAAVYDALERGLAIIRIDADAPMRDAAESLHFGHLDEHEPRAGIRQHTEVRHVPVADHAVGGAVLADWRHVDAVGKLEAIDLVRRE